MTEASSQEVLLSSARRSVRGLPRTALIPLLQVVLQATVVVSLGVGGAPTSCFFIRAHHRSNGPVGKTGRIPFQRKRATMPESKVPEEARAFLQERAPKLRRFLGRKRSLTNREYRSLFDVSRARAARELGRLVEERFLTLEGKGRGTASK